MRKRFIAGILRGVKTVLTFLPRRGEPFVPLRPREFCQRREIIRKCPALDHARSPRAVCSDLWSPPMLSLLSTPVALLEEAFRLADSQALFSFHFDKEMAQRLLRCLEKMATRIGSGLAMADGAQLQFNIRVQSCKITKWGTISSQLEKKFFPKDTVLLSTVSDCYLNVLV